MGPADAENPPGDTGGESEQGPSSGTGSDDTGSAEADEGSTEEPPDDDTGEGDSATEPGGPMFLNFGVNTQVLNEGEAVTFSAVLSDPDGIDDIIGGALRDESGAQYGAFVTTGQEGAYTLTIGWNELETVRDIAFANGGNQQRHFVAEFFDVAGHTAAAEQLLTLECSDGKGYCGGGSCTDTDRDHANCGECGNPCLCVDGACHGVGECTMLADGVAWTCNSICSAQSLQCDSKLCNGVGGVTFDPTECTEDPYEVDGCDDYVGDSPAICCCH